MIASKHFKFSLVTVVIVLYLIYSVKAYAQTSTQAINQSENVSASIGDYYINLSGIIAPNASVVLLTDTTILQTTVADSNGNFYITGVHISRGFTNFCLDAIDFKRLGESYTCFTIPAAVADVTINNIFLPPTLGLQRSEITVGNDAVAWGYTMSNAVVTIHSSDGKTYIVTADATGYYEVNFKITTPGTYNLYADALYQNQQSHIPDKKIVLTAITGTQNILKEGKKKITNINNFIFGSPWAILLLVIPLLITILVLLKKLKPEWFTSIDLLISTFLTSMSLKKHLLHHAWFVGY